MISLNYICKSFIVSLWLFSIDLVQDYVNTVLCSEGVTGKKNIIHFKLHSIKHDLITDGTESGAHTVDSMNCYPSTEMSFYFIP